MIDVVVRSHNDHILMEQTLQGIRDQSEPCRILVMDNESTDGTREIADQFADQVVNIPAGKYVPGAVLNEAMQHTKSKIVVFLNSDCTPMDSHWLKSLIAGFEPNVAACFGRQCPRPDCQVLFAKDTEATFGDGALQQNWKHCFSMASSAILRSAWDEMNFDATIQYSEDIEWTWRLRKKHQLIKYCPDSCVYHSHNYSLRQWYRRQYGEGKADAQIFDWTRWEKNWLRYSAMPFVRQLLGDWKYGFKTKSPAAVFHSPALRFVQMIGRRKGFVDGLPS